MNFLPLLLYFELRGHTIPLTLWFGRHRRTGAIMYSIDVSPLDAATVARYYDTIDLVDAVAARQTFEALA